jgi:hypothetical protein
MAQFGTGPQLAAQCPRPDAMDGWRLWSPDWDGPIPDALAQRAQTMAMDTAVPMGTVESFPLPGVVALIRVETHVWGPDGAGKLAAGCYRVAGLYLPVEKRTLVQPVTRESTWTKTAAVLTAVTLSIGLAATLTSWASSKSRSPAAVARSRVSAWAPWSLPSASGSRRSRSRSRVTRRARRRAS